MSILENKSFQMVMAKDISLCTNVSEQVTCNLLKRTLSVDATIRLIEYCNSIGINPDELSDDGLINILFNIQREITDKAEALLG